MSDEVCLVVSRREVLYRGSQALAAIAVVVAGVRPATAKKSAKDDFFYQEEPNDDGKKCTGCINFTAKDTGQYGKESGDCALLDGDVCNHCYCQGWTDKNSAGAKPGMAAGKAAS